MKVFYSRAFHRDFRDLQKDIRLQAEKQLALFVENPRHPSLGIKRLRGVREPRWEGRITRGYRFTFDWDGDIVVLRRIGPHAIVEREAETYRKALGLREGDEVVVSLEGDAVRIQTVQQALRRGQQLVRRYVPQGRSLAAELIAERRRETRRE